METDISYDDRFTSTRMDVYAPAGDDGDRPAVLVIHGGGWSEGFGLERSGMEDHSRRLAAAGYVAFNLSYRLLGRDGLDWGSFPRPVQDVTCALGFIRGHAADYGIDPDRIAAYGYSAGGHLASMLGVATRAEEIAADCDAARDGVEPVAAVISGAGPQDMSALADVSIVRNFIGGSCDDMPAVCAAASPLSYVAPGAPPFLFIHGEDDWFVDFDHSVRMRAALAEVGTPGKILKLPGGGHIWNQGASGDVWDFAQSIDTPAAWAATIDFLDHTIGDAR